ncbi:DUF763 domain-containing protein [Flavilitoribacter nigricans]|uniref:DUF763 domain-containing protein n=1 Tax=Flavilitoribacter nigricans (strain ATCC 23147 / DSM 23189 / NBRC 102662 / NCIMB 1420 / SS-2) TaxID=1122177 RepID=A0A2D0NI65_FLAN2|nr:DUF763 domain-containing protein [Flavilitoribacter nigricans]PHN08147.1 hypothetical protein CRP01_02160 [Flavilitoribacter nigricans DSM 23189 = NBRC 102662]
MNAPAPGRHHADLPLHYGRVPPWLANRMATLGRAIVEAIVLEYGKGELLQRLSDPLWFQSFGAVLGMDWHSSGITTSVVGALKRAINPISKELGLHVCGGRGRHSRNTPRELLQIADRTGLDGDHLVLCSRLSAKVDNTAIQDGFSIYLHAFVLSDEGEWTVIQQGMNDATGLARRYHWHSKAFSSFLEDPHTYILGMNQGLILNLTDQQAGQTRQGILDLAGHHPVKMIQEIRQIQMPRRHDVLAEDIDLKRLGSILAMAYEQDLQDFESLLLLPGCGPRTLQSLTLVSEVIYGTPSRFTDPARYSFAHGGKDGKPFPVPTKVYDRTINTLRTAVDKAKIGHTDKQKAIRSLHDTARRLEEGFTPNDCFDQLIEREWKESHLFGGKTVMTDPGPRRRKRAKGDERQLRLF